jgi:hypothetical protein
LGWKFFRRFVKFVHCPSGREILFPIAEKGLKKATTDDKNGI